MISRLCGKLIELQPPMLLLDVGGVGYEVSAPMPTFYRLPELGATVTLYTHLVVREDAHALYGFIEKNDKQLFQTLIKASGVGPKLALAIMSGIETREFIGCIEREDATTLVQIPGIGKKTAQRLVIELRDRFKDWGLPVQEPVDVAVIEESVLSGASQLNQASLKRDAENALVSLGYKLADAQKAVKSVAEPELSREEIIRRALQSMVKRSLPV